MKQMKGATLWQRAFQDIDEKIQKKNKEFLIHLLEELERLNQS